MASWGSGAAFQTSNTASLYLKSTFPALAENSIMQCSEIAVPANSGVSFIILVIKMPRSYRAIESNAEF